jgi:hypothetical protein
MFKKVITASLIASLICINMIALAQEKISTRIVSERPISRANYSSWLAEPLKTSTDGKRVAQVGYKQFLILDGKVSGKEYENIGTPVFSPNGKRIAYPAESSGKQFVVIDGKES